MKNTSKKTQFHGYLRRQENREVAGNEQLKTAYNICEFIYRKYCHQHALDFEKNDISDETAINLYDAIYKEFEKQISHSYLPVALFKRLTFFQAINRERKQNGLTLLPTPTIAYRPKRPKNTADFEQFQYLVTAQNIEKQTIDIWKSKTKFSVLDTVTWIMYSLIIYGGVNDENILKSVFEKLSQDDAISSLSKEMLFIPIDISSTKYANQSNQVENSEDLLLTYSRWVFIDDVSRLWLAHLLQIKQNQSEFIFPKYHKCIRRLSEFVGEKFTVKNFEKSKLLKYIPIFWQTLPNVRLDEQSTQLLIGKQLHTALTDRQWQDYLQPLNNTAVRLTLLDFEILQIKNQNTYQTDMDKDKIQSNQTSRLEYRSDFVKDIQRILNGKPSAIVEGLLNLSKQTTQTNHLMLIQWMIDLKSHNKPSTLKRYLTEIGNAFLTNTREADLFQWQEPQYEYLYDSIVAEKNTLKMAYTKTVLYSFHKTLIKSFNAPDVIIEREQNPQMVRSVLISTDTYQSLIESINRQNTIDRYYLDMLMLITMLLYRTGLRISELLGLTISDVEHDTKYSQFNVIVRTNSHRSLKSDDATRRLCLNVLLKPNELMLFQSFFKAKQQHKTNRYLFTLQGQQQPISRHSVEQPLKKLLGKDFSHISLHSFRHNAISNMAVILKCPYDVVSIFTDYTADEAKAIKHHFLGIQREVSSHYWDALMEFAGHADLNTTFASYIHTGDVICASQLAQAQHTLPVGLVMKLTNKEKRSFNQHDSNALTNELVNLPLIRKLINPLLSPAIASSAFKNESEQHIKELDTDNQVTTNHRSLIFGKYDQEKIQSLLTMMEDGKPLEHSQSLGFEYADALKYYQSAVQLAELDKLIYGGKKAKSVHILIAPTLPKTEKEKALVRDALRKIETLYQSKQGKKQIEKMLELFLQKVNKSHTDLRFRFKEKKEFYEFLDTSIQIIPEKHWQVNICAFKRRKNEQAKRGDKKHFVITDEDKQKQTIKIFKDDYPKLANKLTSNAFYSGYSLRLLSPIKVGKEYRASNVFRYVCHLLLVVM